MEEEKVKLHIYLIRHAEKNEDGSAISERGRKQTQLLAKRLIKEDIKKIYSSDLDRCKQTAEIINKYLKLPIYFTSELREVDGAVKENPEAHPREVKAIKSFWDNLVSNEEENMLLVGSGNINRIIIAIALGINPRNSRFVQIPTGLTHMEYFGKNKTRIEYVNDTSHLPDSLKVRQAY